LTVPKLGCAVYTASPARLQDGPLTHMSPYRDDDFDYDGDQQQEEPWRDSKIDQAKIALEDFFEEHPSEVFYERQLEVIFESRFFHWITGKALHELSDEGRLATDLEHLTESTSIRFYRAPAHRYWRRQAREILDLVRAFSAPDFTRALGRHGELMFEAALPTQGFLPKMRKVRAYGGKQWTETGHDLDNVYERDGVAYGVEIKNTLPYIPTQELRAKLRMCAFLGLKPLFIVRMAPKSYIEEVRLQGGFTLVFQYQLYPHGFAELAQKVRHRLLLPVDSPARIADGTIERLLRWHLRTLNPNRQTITYS